MKFSKKLDKLNISIVGSNVFSTHFLEKDIPYLIEKDIVQKPHTEQLKELERELKKFAVCEKFEKVVAQDDFLEQWNHLENHDKSTLLWMTPEIYPLTRKKLAVEEFNFIFDDLLHEMPQYAENWINNSSRVALYKERIAATGLAKDFYEAVKDYDSLDKYQKKEIARSYFKKYPLEKICWYDDASIFPADNHSVKLSTFVTYFFEQEDKINGYEKILHSTKLPKALEDWSEINNYIYYKEPGKKEISLNSELMNNFINSPSARKLNNYWDKIPYMQIALRQEITNAYHHSKKMKP